MRRPFLMACALPLACVLAGPAIGAELQCSCQQVSLCGADECEPSPIETCPSSDIGLSLAEPAIRLCVFTDCLEGEARRIEISETIVALDGFYSPTLEPDLAPTHVLAVIDRETGIGMVQTSDEQAVAQYSIICLREDEN